MLRKRPILTKLPGRGIGLMRHNLPLIRATPLSPPIRIYLTKRMNTIPKKVILRSRIHHSLHVKQVKIQSQMNERVHIIDFHISSNNHPSQLLGHKKAPTKIISASYAQGKTGPPPSSPSTRRPAGSARPGSTTTSTQRGPGLSFANIPQGAWVGAARSAKRRPMHARGRLQN